MPAVVFQVAVGGFDSNFSYLVFCSETKEGFVVDPCGDIQKVFALLDQHQVHLRFILNTHAHFDHIEKNAVVQQKYHVPVFLHPAESYPADRFITDGLHIPFGNCSVTVFHTPGHTPGSVCFLVEHHLFCGDTLFVCSCGRCDLAGGNVHHLYSSLQKLAQLPPETIVYPGHDYGPTLTSTIGVERKQNRFLKMDKSLFLTIHGIA